MASIEVPCANIECDSEDVVLVKSKEVEDEVRHEFRCNFCGCEFVGYTRLAQVKLATGEFS